MKRVINFLFLFALLFVLGGCSTTDLSYNNNALVLQLNSQSLHLNASNLGERRENFGNLYLSYRVLQLDDGNKVVYERARTDSSYEFNFTTMTTIKIVFDAIEIREIYFSNSFYVLQLTLQDGRVLNTIVEQLEDQSLNIVYGLSNKQIYNLLNQLGVDAFGPLRKNVIKIQSVNSSIYSNWTTKKVHFAPLIVPIRLIAIW
jgi:hypothetical protein